METFVMQSQARQLLHNKFVLVLGGSVQRSMYKDLVLLLQRDKFLTLPQLKSKGEFSFEQDLLVEGGRLGPLTNGTGYREVRQYRSDHHLLRFYFLTRIYSPYMESILEDLREGLKPDVVIVSSCVWDITRYGPECLEQYKENLHKFFSQIKALVGRDCLMLWAPAMPLAKKIKGGFLVPEVSHLAPSLCYDIIRPTSTAVGWRMRMAWTSSTCTSTSASACNTACRTAFTGTPWPIGASAACCWGTLLTPGGYICTPPPLIQDKDHSRDTAPSDTNRVTAQTDFSMFQLTQVEQSPSEPCSIMHRRLVTTSKVHPCITQCSVPSTVSRTQLLLESAALPLYFLCSIMLILAEVFLLLDATVSVDYNPLPPANPWLSQRVHPQARAPWSQDDSMLSAGGGLKSLPPARQDDHCMRRGRPNFRSHPLPPILPRVTPRHPTHGW
ncbi:PC-esterase domain containing protein 1A [Dissostichus eleginoides]|uniref:PC-esterase domain containing protein 1A n=1 Tax=Dissostichus eleginoides TaxID=100907 RepID=A0AAD9BXP1_DISEL|nr:PC-esterase domain containing protein 1A [Dissostichus eleginoides]